MKKADFRFPDAQISGSHGWLKWLLVGVSIVTSSSLVFGQNQESLAEQGFASHPFSEVRNARETTRTLYPARAQQLDLGSFSTQEQERVRELLRATTVNYTSIVRDVRLRRSNWALVKQEDGLDVWQAQIRSPSAVRLWLHFSGFPLDPRMSVNVYALAGDSNEEVVEYTGRGLSRDDDGFVAFPTSGDTVVIEFWVPDSYHLEPGDFPFSVEKVSHTFKDNNGALYGEGIRNLAPRRQAARCKRAGTWIHPGKNNYVNSESPAYVHDVTKGVVKICGNTYCGTGSFIKNKSGDGAPYILTVFHLFPEVDANAVDKPFLSFTVTTFGGSYAFGVRYVAGKPKRAARVQGYGDGGGDWVIVRLVGSFSGQEDYKLLEWETRIIGNFSGYSVHHSGIRPQQWDEFESAWAHRFWDVGGKAGTLPFCGGEVCGGIGLTYKSISPTHGGSGSPAFYKKTGLVVGVHTAQPNAMPAGSDIQCINYGFGMGGIYADERAFNILNYGDTYYNNSQFPYMDPELACTASSQAMAGSGTESDPYQVENACHLRDVETSPQSHYIQIKDIDATTMTHGWKNGFTPIKDFSGTYDGNGYQISNLKVNTTDEAFENIGLFGTLQGGLLKRVKLVNFSTKGGVSVGSLVGLNNQGTIEDSEVDGKVDGDRTIGGLVGLNQGGVIRNSMSTVRVGENSRGTWISGGLVGQNDGGTIVGSHASGAVTGGNQVGGLVGKNRGSVTSSYANGDVTGTFASGRGYVGGLVGWHLGGTISDSYMKENDRNIYAKIHVVGVAPGVGGLVGVNEARIVNGHTARYARVSGKDQVGGLVGVNWGSISNSHAQGTVTGDSQTGGLVGVNLKNASVVNGHTARYARVSGKDQIGGLVGVNWGSISNSHAQGTVTGDSQTGGLVGVNLKNASVVNGHTARYARVSGKDQIGGLVGENKGSISNSYALGKVTGDSQTGGLVGENSGTVRSAYSTGAVGGTDLSGRLVGVNSGTIARSYASKLGDGDSLVGENDGIVQGSALRTVEQMKCSIDPVNLCRADGVYLGWDPRIWHFGHSRMLPVLRVLTNVPAAPLAVRANWNSRGGLTLQWEHQGVAVSSFEMEVDGIIRDTEGTRFALGGSLMAELRERYASGSEIHYSIRGVKEGVAGDAASGSFHLMKVPGAVVAQVASGLSTIRVTITEAAADGYGRTLGSSAYGEPAGGVALDLVYHVQLFSKGLLKEERRMTQQEWSSSTVVEFSGLDGGSRYEVRAFARNKAGTDPMAVATPVFTYIEACPQATVITAAGSGSENDPWQVGTLCQLQEIRYDTAAHYRLANDIDAKQSHEWRDGKGFSPIESFSGSLDGSGHSVLSLLINPGQTGYVGLFGRLNGGALQRLALVNVTVQGRYAVGALAGRVEANGSINGSTVTGLIVGRFYVGGVAGLNLGLIKLSHSESTVVGTVDSLGHGHTIGGLVGRNAWGARIRSSHARGSVSGADGVGGLVGRNAWGASIRSSHARGSVSGANSVGGLVGINEAPIYHSHAQSTVSGRGYSVGGLVGSNYGFISGSYSAGAVNGTRIVGGLAGYHGSNSIVDSHSDSTVIGAGVRVGGLVGLSSVSILKSHATGSVSGTEQVGGLVGESGYGSIVDSYATGSVSGNEQVGGLVGNSERYYGRNIRIVDSYATGLVSGNDQAGMLVGHSEGTDMAANYALEPGVGSSALELVGSGEEDTTENNFSRTLAQLQCPLFPGDTCQGAVSYSGWSTQVWYFGDRQTLPVHRALRALPPAPPSRLQAKWNLEGDLELNWTAAKTGSLNAGYWVEVAGRSLETESASFTLGRHLVQNLRSEYGGSDTLQLSVRGYNRHGMSEATTVAFKLLRIPGKLTVVRASAQAFSLQVLLMAPADDGYGQSPEDPAYGYAGVGVSSGLGYRVRLYTGGELMQEREHAHTAGETSVAVEFSGLASDSFYEVEATPYNNVGEGSSFFLSAFTRPWQCDGEILASAGGSGGSGSEDNPWQIATLCQLQDIRSAPAAHYRLAGDIEAGPSRNWRAGEGFAPIADFSGSLDGAGYQIFHLMVRSEVLEDVGMFAQLRGGLLQQIVLVNAQLWGSVNVGTLVGRNEGGRIVDSGATGSLFGGQVAGGLVGINAGTIGGSAAQLTTEPGAQIAGGLVGRNLTGGSVNTSYAGGRVSGAVRAGGLVADNQGSVTDSYTTAFVAGEGLVAGLVANNQGTISRSYAAGPVSGAGQHGSFAGSSPGGIVNSYAAGSVSGAGQPGSFAGSSPGGIDNSYAAESVPGTGQHGSFAGSSPGGVDNSYAAESVPGTGQHGSFAGSNPGGIANSYAAGSVSGAGQHGSFAGSSPGGIVNSYEAELPRVNGGSVPFVADDAGRGSDFLRTLQQLRCPTAPGRACAGRSTYSGWSAETWSFGDYRTLPVLRGFETPGKPLRLQAQWKSPSALLLRWEPPLGGPERIGYRVESGTLFEETLSDYFIAEADWLQKFRVRHEGGSTLFLAVRGYNLYGVGEAVRVSVRLLDVPDSPADMRVEPRVTKLRLSFTAPANDGYGRKPVDADYAASVEAMALRLAYRIRLYASGKLVEERDIPLGNPLSPVMVEFAGLKSAFEYRLEAFAHNTVGSGSPSTIRTVTRFSECADKGLKSAQGDGSNDNPWQIATLCQLQDVRSDLYAHYVQVADIDASPSRGWSGGAGFHPIEPFSGTFDGAGREISDLYINRPETDTIGLFSRLAEDGVAKRVVLVDAWVKGGNSVGAMVGFNDGTVMNSVVRSAQVSGNRAGLNIGGLAGGNGGLLIDSGASAEVDGGRYVGGLVGYVKAKGRVVGSTVKASQVHALESAGGLAGLALGAAILYSSADAAVRVSGDRRGNAGGLVGYSRESTILHCYATGSAIAVDGSRAGGLVGYSGSTIAYSYADVSVSGDSRVGGLVGINAGSVHASYALGEVQGRSITGGLVGSNIRRIQDSYAVNSVDGGSYVGESGGLFCSGRGD